MSTRFYLGAAAETTPISPTPDSAWEDQTILARARARTTASGRTMATVSFTDNNAANRDVLFMQFVSHPLAGSQTITGSQALKAQALVKQRATTNNMLFSVGIRVIAVDGSTVQKTVLVVTRDGVAADATTLTNRQFTATSAATNYTTVAGDYIVIEIGMSGDPNVGNDHDSDIRLGDAAASDLAENDTDTGDLRPWVELTDTLTFTGETSTVTLSESETVSEVPLHMPTYVLTESETIAEAVVRAVLKVLSESETPDESVVRLATKLLAESVTVNESFVTQLTAGGKLETLAEQMTLDASVVRIVDKIIAESVSSEDSLIRSMSKVIAETVTAQDSLAFMVAKVLGEPVTLSEATVRTVTKVIAESLTPAEAVTASILAAQFLLATLAEGITVSESALRIATKLIAETITTEESLALRLAGNPYGLRTQHLPRLIDV